MALAVNRTLQGDLAWRLFPQLLLVCSSLILNDLLEQKRKCAWLWKPSSDSSATKLLQGLLICPRAGTQWA
eukprot:1710307-Amphidinium_carterae.1